MRPVPKALLALVALPVWLGAGDAWAEPQANVGLTVGAAGVDRAGAFWDHAEFHLGVRGDVLFGRARPYDFGVGPYLEVGTLAFDEIQFGGGASVLLPVHDRFPLITSLGAYGRAEDDGFGVEPGLVGSLFWGTRSYNFHANYVMSAGLLLSYRHSLGASRESALTLAVQLDLAVMALPVVMLINWLRGPTGEAAALDGPASR